MDLFCIFVPAICQSGRDIAHPEWQRHPFLEDYIELPRIGQVILREAAYIYIYIYIYNITERIIGVCMTTSSDHSYLYIFIYSTMM
jgi:hypothetical protein